MEQPFLCRTTAQTLTERYWNQVKALYADTVEATRLDTELSILIADLKSHVGFFQARGEKWTIDWLIIYYQSLHGRIRKAVQNPDTAIKFPNNKTM